MKDMRPQSHEATERTIMEEMQREIDQEGRLRMHAAEESTSLSLPLALLTLEKRKEKILTRHGDCSVRKKAKRKWKRSWGRREGESEAMVGGGEMMKMLD